MTKKFTILLFLVLLTWVHTGIAATVDTVLTYSVAMKKNIKAVVIMPGTGNSKASFPVLYLLHGHGGNYRNWITKVPELQEYAERYQMMIVCPDGNVSSWYFDSKEQASSKYETYIATELVNWIDQKYPTIKGRTGRAITGLSMGGHGALYLAFRHQDVFGAAGSMSGGLDLRPFPNNWNLAAQLGKYADKPEQWERNSVINLTHLLTPGSLKLLIDCGSGDFFYGVNTAFHQKLLNRNIPHDFISREGTHNWDYWRNAVEYQLLFMQKYFRANKSLSD